jgi:hypothetical protein
MATKENNTLSKDAEAAIDNPDGCPPGTHFDAAIGACVADSRVKKPGGGEQDVVAAAAGDNSGATDN